MEDIIDSWINLVHYLEYYMEDCMTEQERWEEEHNEWWQLQPTGPRFTRNCFRRSEESYLAGRRKGQEEIEKLKVKINHLAEDIKQMEETIKEVNSTPIRKHFDRSYRAQE